MATRFDNVACKPATTTTAIFRANIQFIEDTLVTTGGWVVTGDSGQLVISTAPIPTSANQKVGYRIYRMADALQATVPVFMRIDYGSTSTIANFGIWITLGEGSDGSGNITTKRFDGGAVTAPTVACGANNAAATCNSYGSANTNRVQIGMFVQTTASLIFAFSIERTKDTSGADTGGGLIFIYTGSGTSMNFSRVVVYGGGSQPPVEGLLSILSDANPSSFGGDVGVGIPIPLKGVAQPPGYGVVISRSSDFVAESQFAMTIYGVSINYIHLNALQATRITAVGGDTAARTHVRYD